MIVKLDPRWPLVWRTPTSMQIGIDPPRVVLHDVTTDDERMLAALGVGVSRPGLDVIGRGTAEHLLARLAPVLLEPTNEDAPREPVVGVSGAGSLSVQLASVLGHHGVRVLLATDHTQLAGSAVDLAVHIADFVTPPDLHGFWLRRDTPHLVVLVTESGASYGPVIEPGSGPCLVCIDLHHRDDDPQWAAIATQLLTRRVGIESAVLDSEVVGAVGRLVLRRLDGHTVGAISTRVDRETGLTSTREWTPHADCGCHAVGDGEVSATQTGIGSASAARHAPDRSSPTTRARAIGELA